MTRTHLIATRREDLSCDASALSGGGPDRPDGGTGGLSRARSGGDGLINDVNNVAEASATSLTTQINEQLGAASDDLWISPTAQLEDKLVFKEKRDVMASDHGLEGVARL
ncbi:hypothetical protein GUJ93_ZPchr0006g41293 [Zizania palustris]|uniref:Uncharacterized protein n=1 Tax=Zizania palustris TaxID=103762 RepID=A0A8J5T2W5_ZIZPA|nr:hypothetical protein GUJ93_ZPchr0006g41293 [Zizania palustris]